MKKYFFLPLFIMLCFGSVRVSAQENKAIFEEHFNNNDNKWKQFDTTWATQKLDSGVYIVQRRNKFGNGESRTISFDALKDFSIECTVRLRSGDKANLYGIIFGFKDWDNNYGLLINNNGNYSCQNYYQGTNYAASWKTSAVINKNGSNKLGIIKFGNWLNFYINDVYMQHIPYQPLLSQVFVLYAGGNQTVVFDDFVVKYCNKDSYMSLFGETELNKMNAAYTASKGKYASPDDIFQKHIAKPKANTLILLCFRTTSALPTATGKQD